MARKLKINLGMLKIHKVKTYKLKWNYYEYYSNKTIYCIAMRSLLQSLANFTQALRAVAWNLAEHCDSWTNLEGLVNMSIH